MTKQARTSKTDKPTKLDFNHVLLYVNDVKASKAFYQSLGFDLVEDEQDYARLRAPGGSGTIAIRLLLSVPTINLCQIYAFICASLKPEP